MAAGSDRLRQAAQRVVGEAVKEAVHRAVAEVKPPAAPAAAQGGPATFRSSVAYAKDGRASALVIACNSYLFLPQTLEFVEKGLGLHGFDLIAVPGGMQWLALPDILPKHSRVARWAVEYLLRKHQIPRVIGIAHEGCSAYEDASTLGTLAHLATGKSADAHQREHLLRVGRDLRASFGVPVELYYAAVEGDGTVAFTPLEPAPGKSA